MTHPCSTHLSNCDHCFYCDELGVCCATVPADARAGLEAKLRTPTQGLIELVVREAGSAPSLAELVRAEAAVQDVDPSSTAPPALAAAPHAAVSSQSPRKEAHSVQSPGSVR